MKLCDGSNIYNFCILLWTKKTQDINYLYKKSLSKKMKQSELSIASGTSSNLALMIFIAWIIKGALCTNSFNESSRPAADSSKH